MKLYHSFPRLPRSTLLGEDQRTELGVSILASIMAYGVLLTPEPLEIPPNPDSDLDSPPRTSITQYRACFTLSSRDDLLEPGGHSALFGRFAIGLDSLEARELGAVPTFYYYPQCDPARRDSPEDAGISQDILFRLSELRRLLIALAHVEATAIPSDPYAPKEHLDAVGLTIDDEPDVANALTRLRRRDAEKLFFLLNNDRVPAWNLAEWIELILSMFQTADSQTNNRHLAYFAQREWRIIQLYNPHLICLPLAKGTSDDISDELLPILDALRKHLRYLKASYDFGFKSNDTFLLFGSAKRRFRDYVQEIVSPISVHDDVCDILNQSDWPFAVEILDQYSVFSRCP